MDAARMANVIRDALEVLKHPQVAKLFSIVLDYAAGHALDPKECEVCRKRYFQTVTAGLEGMVPDAARLAEVFHNLLQVLLSDAENAKAMLDVLVVATGQNRKKNPCSGDQEFSPTCFLPLVSWGIGFIGSFFEECPEQVADTFEFSEHSGVESGPPPPTPPLPPQPDQCDGRKYHHLHNNCTQPGTCAKAAGQNSNQSIPDAAERETTETVVPMKAMAAENTIEADSLPPQPDQCDARKYHHLHNNCTQPGTCAKAAGQNSNHPDAAERETTDTVVPVKGMAAEKTSEADLMKNEMAKLKEECAALRLQQTRILDSFSKPDRSQGRVSTGSRELD